MVVVWVRSSHGKVYEMMDALIEPGGVTSSEFKSKST